MGFMDPHAIAGGKGGQSGAEASKNTSNQALIDMAKQFATETQGLRTGLIGQFEDILKTGGSQATVPIIAKATEASKKAASQALTQTNEELARTGLAGTPFGENIASQSRLSGNLAVAQTPTDIAMSFLQMIPNFILGQGQTALAGVGTGATNQTNLAAEGMRGLYKTVNLGK